MTWPRSAETVIVWAANLMILGGLLLALLVDLPDAVVCVQGMWCGVEPMDFDYDNQRERTIGYADTVLLYRKGGGVVVPRDFGTCFCCPDDERGLVRLVLGRSKHRPGGEVYVVVDKGSRRQESETLLNMFSSVATDVFVVGRCPTDTSRNVCERWKGAWDKMICRGPAIDISSARSLWYADPYVWYRPYAWAVDFANGRLGKRFEKRITY